MRGKAPRGKTKTPEGRTPQGRTATREGNAPRPEQGTPARNGERDLGTTRPKHPRKGEGERPETPGRKATGAKVHQKDPKLSEVWRHYGWRGGKTTGETSTVLKSITVVQKPNLAHRLTGSLAKQQPTSGEPEKLKAQVHFQEPNDE